MKILLILLVLVSVLFALIVAAQVLSDEDEINKEDASLDGPRKIAPPGKPFVTEVKLGEPAGPIVVTPLPPEPGEDKPTRPQVEIKPD